MGDENGEIDNNDKYDTNDVEDMDEDIAEEEDANNVNKMEMTDVMVIIEHKQASSPGNETDRIIMVEMSETHTDKKYDIGGGDNNHIHEHDSRGGIGCSHYISNQGRVEIINNKHVGPAGNKASYPF